MKLRFLRDRALAELKSSISDNLDRYRAGDFGYLSLDPALSFETGIDVNEAALSKLRPPEGDEKFDSENCVIFWGAMKKSLSLRSC